MTRTAPKKPKIGVFDLFTYCLMLFSVICMHSRMDSSPRLRAGIVVATVSIAGAAAAWSLVGVLRDTYDLVGAAGPTSVEELVIAGSAAAALALLLWVALGLLASVAAMTPGPLGALSRSVRDTIAPETVRRSAAVLLGVAVMSSCGPTSAVASHGAAQHETRSAAQAGSPAPTPVWGESAELVPSGPPEPAAPMAPAPDWTPQPTRALPSVTLTAPRAQVSAPSEVTVRRGDTLWDLAAAYLAPEATDAEVAAEWQRWYAANRDVIGADPDRILPGQVLRIPMPADAAPAVAGR